MIILRACTCAVEMDTEIEGKYMSAKNYFLQEKYKNMNVTGKLPT